MTVAADFPLALYDGDGVTTVFAAPWRYLDSTLLVEKVSSTGVETVLVAGIDYSATAGETDAGGNVTLNVAPAIGEQVRVRRTTPMAQPTAYPTSGTFPAKSHELAMDRLTLGLQEAAVDLARVPKVAPGATPPAFDMDNIAPGQVLGLVDGKIAGIDNDPASAADSAAVALGAKTAAETALASTQSLKTQTEALKNGALAAIPQATGYLPGARSYVPQGAVLGAGTISAAGSGGTNGTFALAFTGGNFAVNPTGTFTVAGGAVTAITITGPGLYVGNALSKPTLSFAASSGLTGAGGTFDTRYLKLAGETYLTDHASDPSFVSLFQNQGNAAVELDPAVDPFSAGAAAMQVALASEAAANLQAEAIGAKRGGTVADTGKQVLSLVGIDGGTSNLTATFARWARFRDAGSVDDETTIKTGSIVSGIALTAAVLATAAKARGRVWRRPLSSGSLNAAPGSAPDDVLLRDTGIVAIADDLLTMVGSSQIYLNIPVTKFEVLAGYAYGFDFEIYDASDTLLTATARYTTTAALAQRHAGFYYATTGAGSFTAQTTTRPIRMGYSTPSITSNLTDLEKKAERKLAATANSSKLTDLERLAISRQGAWSGPNKIIRPNYPSYRHGLARLGLTDGAYGVDYGPRIALADMTEMTAVPGVDLTSNAAQIRFGSGTANAPKGAVYSGLKQIGSRGIYQPTANWARLFLSDCYMDGQAAIGMPVTIQQVANSGVTKFPYVEIEHCDFRYFTAGVGNIYNGAIRRSLVLRSGSNAVQVQQDYANGSALILEQNLFLYVGTADAGAAPTSHSDVLEMNRAQSLSAVGNVYVLPSTGTTYDPGQYGTTNCIRHSAEVPTSPISNCYHLGELIIGGNSPVGMNMRGGTIVNMLYAFNKYSTDEYHIYNNYIALTGPQAGDTGITTDWCNLAFFDEYRVNGTPTPIGGGTPGTVNNAVPATYYARAANTYRANEEKWGIFNWDKARATPKFIEALQLLGLSTGRTILDSNNDLNSEYDLGALKATN